LQQVITRLPGNLPCGVVVVQHMPAGFTKALADRLDTISQVSVKEAEDGDIIQPGHVYIAPGSHHLRVREEGSSRRIVLGQDPPVGNHRPAVNVMYDSVAPIGKNLVAVIMTGMGCDGCEGMKKIKAAGGYSIAQDEPTCVVYGMPKAVVDAGLADEIKPIQNIAQAIVEAVKR
jgi:two-component system chemotaxis response regulator CheB